MAESCDLCGEGFAEVPDSIFQPDTDEGLRIRYTFGVLKEDGNLLRHDWQQIRDIAADAMNDVAESELDRTVESLIRDTGTFTAHRRCINKTQIGRVCDELSILHCMVTSQLVRDDLGLIHHRWGYPDDWMGTEDDTNTYSAIGET